MKIAKILYICFFLVFVLFSCPNNTDDRAGVSLPLFYDVTIDKTTVNIGDSLTVKYYTEPSKILDYDHLTAKVVNTKLIETKGSNGDGSDISDIIFFNVEVSDDLVESKNINGHRLDYFDAINGSYPWPTVHSEKVTYYHFDEETRITTVIVTIPNEAKTGFIKINDSLSIGGIGFCPTKLTVIE